MPPVTLSVTDVRRAIWLAAGGSGQPGSDSEPSSARAGRLFHQTAAWILGSGAWQDLFDADSLAEDGAARELALYTYRHFLGLELRSRQASLREDGAEVVALWASVEALCGHLTGILRQARQRGRISYDAERQRWSGSDWIWSEQPLRWTVRQPGWRAPVEVTGTADAILRDPETGHWCVVEWKVGRQAPEADLAQACLYHRMLSESETAPGVMGLLGFHPQLQQTLWDAGQLAQAQSRLVDLIGRLAGVTQAGFTPVETAPAMSDLGQRLTEALRHHGAPVRLNGAPVVGPRFIRFSLLPERGVRVKTVESHAVNLQVQLGLEAAPYIHVTDSGRLVADLVRPDPQVVSFAGIRTQLPAEPSRFPVGVDLSGRLRTADLADPNSAHWLVAGTTGSGKSEWLRMAVTGMLLVNTPETLRLVVVDPKRVAFGDLADSPFLWRPGALLFPPEDDPIPVLEALQEEMERRWRLFEDARADDIASYARRTGLTLPRIVFLCDEFADLVASRRERQLLETAVKRLGAKARAAGIHLMLATQRPDRDTVTGILKANLSARVCLRVTSETESRIALGAPGGSALLGKGDLLWSHGGEIVRLQAPYLDPAERMRIWSAGKQADRR